MIDPGTASVAATARWNLDGPLSFRDLVYLPEGDEVTIGRQDIDAYGVFPADGAEVVKRLAAGDTPRLVTAWYEAEYGERLDIEDLLEALDELGFIQTGDQPRSEGPVRWRRLGTAVFSPPALVCYAVIIVLAVIAMIRHPDVAPHYRNIFFTDYYTIVQVTLFLAAIPLLLVHESFHALGGRRLGLRTRLTIGRRLYFIVLETSLDGLVVVPRRKRYLPILAGVLADLVGVAILTVVADFTRTAQGTLSPVGQFCLAVAFAAVLRVVWQCYFYLRTDLYALIHTMLGCVDLHTVATQMLRNRVNRLLGRRDRLADETDWHPADRRAARWYSWLIVVGYTASIATLALAGIPILYEFATGVLSRFLGGSGVSREQQLDAIVFGSVALLQILVLGCLIIRDRRKRRRERALHHLIT
jgi:hypothetical protein